MLRSLCFVVKINIDNFLIFLFNGHGTWVVHSGIYFASQLLVSRMGEAWARSSMAALPN